MNHHTQSAYDKQLGLLTEDILKMGALVKELVIIAKRSLIERNPSLVDEARAKDKEVNALDYRIEHQVAVVLALRNPMAVDLRFVTSALKIAGALERAGDLAKNTAKRSVKLENYMPAESTQKLERMVEIVIEMMDEALAAVERRDSVKATEVWKRDDEVDDLYHDMLAGMQKEMLAHPENILAYTHFVFAAKNFERIADYATNLAKTVHYITTGKPADKASMKSAALAAAATASEVRH